MTLLAKQLEQVIAARRREILPYLFDRFNGRVQTGPFAGMTIVPEYSWGDGDSPAKLLGVYECELHSSILDAVHRKPDKVINIGCAEGYYAIGLSRLLMHVPVTAIDISKDAITITTHNAAANSCRNLEYLQMPADAQWLEKNIAMPERPLLIVDCESFELKILDLTLVPSLTKATILVECHDCMVPGITDTLVNRFRDTHTIEKIKQQSKDPYQFVELEEFSDADKWAIVSEGRPSTMTWLYMVPKE